MSFYWQAGSGNTVPVRVSMALYGPPNCGPQGESQLLGVTSVYTIAAGQLSAFQTTLVNIPLTSPVIVGPGSYAVFAEADTANLTVVSAYSSTSNLVADAYTRNSYNYSAARFPNRHPSLHLPAGPGHAGRDRGPVVRQCDQRLTVPPHPPVSLPPSSPPLPTPPPLSPARPSAVVYTNTYNSSGYTYEMQAPTNAVRLVPLTITISQTLYAVSFLIHPETSATTTFTLRPALYAMSPTAGTFLLLGQTAPTPVSGSSLSGQFTSLYLPLASPVYVAVGSTVYLNPLVDQPGLYLVYTPAAGSTYTSASSLLTTQPAPATLTTTGTGAQDASRGLLGCAGPPPPVSSSSTAQTLTGLPSSALSSTARTGGGSGRSTGQSAGQSTGPAGAVVGGGSSSDHAAIIGGVVGGAGGALMCCALLLGCVVWRRAKKGDGEEVSVLGEGQEEGRTSQRPSEAEMSTMEPSQVEGRLHDDE